MVRRLGNTVRRKLLAAGVTLGAITLSVGLIVSLGSNPFASSPPLPALDVLASAPSSSSQQRTTDTDRILVSFTRASSGLSGRAQAVVRRAAASIAKISVLSAEPVDANTISVRLSRTITRAQAQRIATATEKSNGVDYAEPAVNFYPDDAEVAPIGSGYGWNLDVIRANQAWASSNGEPDGAGIVVGVIDTGMGANSSLPKAVVVKPTNGNVISGTTWPGLTVTLQTSDPSYTTTVVADGAGNWTYKIPDGLVLPDRTPVTVSVSDTSTGAQASLAPITTATVTIDKAISLQVPSAINTDTVAGKTDAGASVSVTNGSSQTVCHTTADSHGAFSCPVSPAVSGGTEADFTVTATDPAGNTATTGVRIDKKAPAAPSVDLSNGRTVVVTGIESGAGSKVIDTGNNDAVVAGSWTGSATDGTRTFTPTDRLIESTNRYQVEITDAAGNSTKKDFTVDTTAPALTVVSPSTGDLLTGTGEAGAKVTAQWSTTVSTHATIDSDGNWTLPKPDSVTLTTDQPVSVIAADSAGNETPATVIIDRTPPPAPVIHATDGLSLNGTAEARATIEIRYLDSDSQAQTAKTSANGDGIWFTTLNPRAGDRTKLSVTATDEVGNTSEATTASAHYGPPSAPAVAPSDGKTVTVLGIQSGDKAALTTNHGDPIDAACAEGAAGGWTCTPTQALTEASDVYAVAIDDAGNTSPRTAVRVDTTAPQLTVTSATATSITVEANEALAGLTVTFRTQADVEQQAQARYSNGAWTAILEPAAQAGSDLTVTATDLAGNSATTKAATPTDSAPTPTPATPQSVATSIIEPQTATTPTSTATSGDVNQRAELGGNTVEGTVLPGYDFLDSDSDATANGRTGIMAWHGTHVAGIIAAKRDVSYSQGVAAGVKIVPIRALGTGTSGHTGDTSDIARAITWGAGLDGGTGATTNPYPADVLNLSLGAEVASCPKDMQEAITAATNKGVTVVVSAGNDNTNIANTAPANCQGVIVVTATGKGNSRATYSNWGSTQTRAAHLIAAPGGSGNTAESMIVSTVDRSATESGWAAMSGTSQAAPQVSATVALMMAKARKNDLKYTLNTYANILENTTYKLPDECPTGICGYGLLNAGAAVDAVGEVSPDSDRTQPPTQGLTFPTLRTVRSWPSVLRTGAAITAPVASSYAYRTTYTWYRSGQVSPIAYGLTYAPTGADYGKTLSVRTTDPATGATNLSRAPRTVSAGYLISRKLPTISGTVKVGRRLSVTKGTWSAGVSAYKYQWYRNGKAIRGASKYRYTLTRSDRGKRIQARVWVKSTGYYSTNRYSAKTVAVRG